MSARATRRFRRSIRSTGRLARAQANFQETFPIAIVALLGVVIADRTSQWTALGGWIWLGARTIYLPLYAMGVPVVRTLVYTISIAGLGHGDLAVAVRLSRPGRWHPTD